jgi:hypothetical protein
MVTFVNVFPIKVGLAEAEMANGVPEIFIMALLEMVGLDAW